MVIGHFVHGAVARALNKWKAVLATYYKMLKAGVALTKREVGLRSFRVGGGGGRGCVAGAAEVGLFLSPHTSFPTALLRLRCVRGSQRGWRTRRCSA